MACSKRHHDTAENMSIAIEMKFLVAFLPKRGRNHEVLNTPQLADGEYADAARSLEDDVQLGQWRETFSAVARTIGEVPGQQAITTDEIDSLGAEERDFWETHWIVKKSNSAEALEGDADYDTYHWAPVEVNSPKMVWKDEATLTSTREVLSTVKSRHHVVSNCTCEVHVHVGRLDNKLFSLPVMKRMAMLLWLAEPVMRLVKDPSSPNFHHVYTWSSAAREHSRLAASLRAKEIARAPRDRQLGVFDGILAWYLTKPDVRIKENQQALRHILGAKSHVELGRLMSGEGRPYRRLGYNFSAIGEEDVRARTKPKTIEARFLEGTSAEDVVLSWIQIFATMLEVAMDRPETEGRFANAILRLAEAESPYASDEDFVDLMEVLGIHASVYWPIQSLIRRIHLGAKRE